MRTKEVEEAIKVLDKYKIRLLQTRKEIGLVEDFKNHHTEKQYNRCGKRAKSIETVLSYIEELEAKLEFKQFGDLDSLQFENTYLDKQVIRDKIKELENKIKIEHNEKVIVWLHKQKRILESLLGE